MVPVTPMFPLFKMPYLAYKNVLETMPLSDLIKSSLCSRQCKLIIRSLFRQPCNLLIQLLRTKISVHIDRFANDCTLDHTQPELRGPSTLSVDESEQIPAGLDVKEWVRHLMEAFNCDGVRFSVGFNNLDIEDIQRVLEGLEIHEFSCFDCYPEEYLGRALMTFPPTKRLLLWKRPKPFPRDIRSRVYDKLRLLFEMSIKEILSLNSKEIKLVMEDIQLNKVMKRWVDGWNTKHITRLTVMIFQATGNDIRTTSLKRLECHPLTGEWKDFEGSEIRNRFGRKAFVVFNYGEKRYNGSFYTNVFFENQ